MAYIPSANVKILYPAVEITEESRRKIRYQEKRGFILKENVTASHQWFSRNTDLLQPIDSIYRIMQSAQSSPTVFRTLALTDVAEPYDNKNGDFEKEKSGKLKAAGAPGKSDERRPASLSKPQTGDLPPVRTQNTKLVKKK